jgi:two-component system response regulator YesN
VLILLVDDDRLARQGLAALLSQLMPEAELCEAADGIEMVEAVRSRHPEVAIVDVDMPRLDGLSAIEVLAQAEHETSFVVLSAHADFSFARRGIQLHVADYLLKPADPAALVEAVRHAAAEGRRQQREREAVFRTEVNELVKARLRPDRAEHEQLDGSGATGEFVYLAAAVFADGPADAVSTLDVTESLVADISGRRRLVAAVRTSAPDARTPVGVLMVRHPAGEGLARIVDGLCQDRPGCAVLSAFWSAGPSPEAALAAIEPTLLDPSLRLLGRPGRALPVPVAASAVAARCCAALDAVLEAVHLADQVRYTTAVDQLMAVGTPWPRELALGDVATVVSARLGYPVPWGNPRKFFEALADFAPKVGRRASAPAASRISRIQEYLAENFAEPLSLASVAKRFELTPTYLSALFHAKTGKTFLAYLTELRVAYACKVLEADPDVQVRELASLSGYTSVRHFSQVFRRLTGSYPSKYVEEVLGGPAPAGRPAG